LDILEAVNQGSFIYNGLSTDFSVPHFTQTGRQREAKESGYLPPKLSEADEYQ
jgi:hypothetical protein